MRVPLLLLYLRLAARSSVNASVEVDLHNNRHAMVEVMLME